MTSNWNGAYYAKNSEMQFLAAKEALKLVDFPPKAKILDIGCGDGRITKYIADQHPECTLMGVDRSSSMLATAKQYADSRLTFQLADAAALPFESQFDRIVSFNCLHWVPDIRSALKNIKRALVPGGRTLALIAPTQARYPIHRILNEVASREKWRSFFTTKAFTHYSFAEWAEHLEEAGLVPEQMQLIDASQNYPGKKAFADWIAGWIPFGTIPENQRAAYLDDMVEAYTAVIPCEKGGAVPMRLDELVMKAARIA